MYKEKRFKTQIFIIHDEINSVFAEQKVDADFLQNFFSPNKHIFTLWISVIGPQFCENDEGQTGTDKGIHANN